MNPDYASDHRERLARQRAEELTAQRSPLNGPDARVKIWERLHQVQMPVDPAHRLLNVIAKQTDLHLTDVLEVQRQRQVGGEPDVPGIPEIP
jgi:hypothetical protein